MIELGELEAHHRDFADHNVRLVAVSLEGPDEARLTQKDFPSLTVIADRGKGLSSKAGVVGEAPTALGGDRDIPTTILIDRAGTVRQILRPDSLVVRLTPQELREAIDKYLPGSQ